jgi:hypothetical protein
MTSMADVSVCTFLPERKTIQTEISFNHVTGNHAS